METPNSIPAVEAVHQANEMYTADEELSGGPTTNDYFDTIPDKLIKHVLSFLDGPSLAKSREVCRKWEELACDEHLWKSLCVERWRSLETDAEAWKFLDKGVDENGPNTGRWRMIYPKVRETPQWTCRLQKTGQFICNLVAHQISGTPLSELGLPNVMVIERRFNIEHLETFVLPDAAGLYFEPEKESDRAGFDDFIEYLHKRSRAGLALEDHRRFILIPPCLYTQDWVNYHGRSLLGAVQNAHPPLAP